MSLKVEIEFRGVLTSGDANCREGRVLTRTAEATEALAYHEAAHAVAAIVHHVPFEFVTIVRSEAIAEHTGERISGHIKPLSLSGDYQAVRGRGKHSSDPVATMDFWHRVLIMTMAGPAVSVLVDKEKHVCFDNDMLEAQEVIAMIADTLEDNAVTLTHFNYIKALAVECVEEHLWQIDMVAAALVERNTLTEDEVRQAMAIRPPSLNALARKLEASA